MATAPDKSMTGSQCHHIAFGVDAQYFRAMGVMIASIIRNNPGQSLVFHVFTFALPERVHRRLRSFEAPGEISVVVHLIDESMLEQYAKFTGYTHYSAAIFTRLLIPRALQGITDKVLYLDADMLCLTSLAGLFATDLEDCIVALVPDNDAETSGNQSDRLQLRHRQYFNSGLLYVNIENWISNGISEQAMQLILVRGQEFMFPDQDALNIVLDGRTRLLQEKWNFQFNLDNLLKEGDTRTNPPEGTAITHFTGRVKPWHNWCLHEARNLFLQYQAHSPWADMPLDCPRHYKEMRMYSQFLAKQGRVDEAALWYAKYLRAKFMPWIDAPERRRKAAGRGADA